MFSLEILTDYIANYTDVQGVSNDILSLFSCTAIGGLRDAFKDIQYECRLGIAKYCHLFHRRKQIENKDNKMVKCNLRLSGQDNGVLLQ